MRHISYGAWRMTYGMWHMKSDYISECSPARLNILSKPAGPGCMLLIVMACLLSSSCAKTPPQRVEEKPLPPGAGSTVDAVTVKRAPELPAATPAEVEQAIGRVFKGAVTIETDRSPYFAVGDFNGDSSQDLAVVVRPERSKLLEINDELSPWILVEPVRTARPTPKGAYPASHSDMARRRRVVIDEGDRLLAVIHGFEAKGWRDSQATQTYVLKDAVGAEIETQARKQIVWDGNKDKLPRIWGDVIAQSINEQYGFLYYNGAKYDWYTPRSYKPEAPARIVHGGGAKAMK
jgi:hypothetical protein